MSVINKMLKDLEQREQGDELDFDPSGAVYKAKAKSKMPMILVLMLIVILALAGTVAWLVYKGDDKTLTKIAKLAEPVTEVLNKSSEKTESSSEVTEKPQGKTESVAQQRPSALIPRTEAEQANELDNAAANNIADTADEVRVEESVAQEKILDPAMMQTETKSPAIDEVTTEPEAVIEQPKIIDGTDSFTATSANLKIEKSSTTLSREERIANLMVKANSSYDKGYISDAITQLEEVLASKDDHVEARNLLAVAWYGRGELQQAVSILNNGLNRYPSIEMWRLTAAKIFFKENQKAGAFSYLEADLSAASTEYYSMKGSLARQLKRFDKAESAYANLTNIEPDKGNWWLGYAIALDSQNKTALAIESYKTALAKSGISQGSVNFARERVAELQRIQELQD